MRNGTILTLHINTKSHNVVVCAVGTLNSSNNAFFGVWPLDYYQGQDLAGSDHQIHSCHLETIYPMMPKGPVKLMQWVKIAYSFMQSVSNQFYKEFFETHF